VCFSVCHKVDYFYVWSADKSDLPLGELSISLEREEMVARRKGKVGLKEAGIVAISRGAVPHKGLCSKRKKISGRQL